jgi:hypothetical protein
MRRQRPATGVWRRIRAGTLAGILALLEGPWQPCRAVFTDADGNGIDDQAEVLLAERFRPVLILPEEDMGMRPAPVGILGDGGPLTADKLWARVYNVAGQLVTVVRTTDAGWDPAPVFASPSFPYAGYGWDKNALTYIGSPPGAAYYLYFVRLHPDYGGPSVDCPDEWRALYANGDGFHPRGADLPAHAYVHLFLEQGLPVIQYWFFFPFNDWVNDHEGDWEHIHLRVSSSDPESAELLGACYYFHDLALQRSPSEIAIADGTHPVVWVGGRGEWSCGVCDASDCPGGDGFGSGSHGSYPAPGAWPGVGADVQGCGRASESVERCGRYLHWADLQVEILPAPSAVDFGERPDLSWHEALLPFGTPFVPSFCDDACEFFDDFPLTGWLVGTCGNGAPVGPSHHSSWNVFAGGAPGGSYTRPVPASPSPRVLRVPSEISTLSRAADCALAGDTILVAPGTHTSAALLPGGVTVLSEAGAEATVWKAPPARRQARVRTGATGTRIGDTGRGFTFRWNGGLPPPSDYVLLASEGESVLRGNRFDGFPFQSAVYVPPGGGTVRIESNTFSVPTCAIRAQAAPGQTIEIGGSLEDANDFLCAAGAEALDAACDSCPPIRAEYNYWGTLDADTIRSLLAGSIDVIDFDPYTDSAHAVAHGPSVGVAGAADRADAFAFERAEPNPASGEIALFLRIARRAEVRVRVYDVRGRVVLEPWRGPLGEGERGLAIDVRSLPSGVYFVRAEGERQSAMRKVVLVH